MKIHMKNNLNKKLELSLKEYYKETEKKQKTEHKIAAIAGATAVAGSAYPVAEVGITQTKSFDTSLYKDLNPDKNTPLNKDTIVIAHNAGDNTGDTLPGLSNQQMSTNQLLTLTSNVNGGIAAVQFPTAIGSDGQWDVNHGGISDGSPPTTLESQFSTINTWAEQNPNSIVLIQVSNQGSSDTPEQQAQFDQIAKEQFGDSLFTQQDLQEYQAENHTTNMPSQQWLTDHGYHEVIVSEGINSNGSSIPASSFEQSQYYNTDNPNHSQFTQYHNEDRAPLLYFLHGIGLEKIPIIDTNTSDQLSSQPGFIALDNLQPNDPRLVDPSKRNQLIYDPDMSMFGGLVEANRGAESIAAFTFGLTLSEASASFAIANSLYKAYQNHDYIKNLGKNIQIMVSTIDKADLDIFKEKNKRYQKLDNKELIHSFCKEKVYKKITTDTIIAGISGTSSITGATSSLGAMIPPIAPITTAITILGAGTGLLGTAAGVAYNRFKLQKNIDQAFEQNKELIEYKANNSNHLELDAEKILREKKTDSILDQTSESLQATSLFFRVSGMAKYAVSTIGLMAGGIGSVFTGFSGALDLAKGSRQRQKNYENIPKYVAGLLIENIYQKPYLFFGESKLEKYVKKSFQLNGKKLSEYINDLDDEKFKQLSSDCAEFYLKQDMEKFLTSKKLNNNEDNINKYIKHKVGKNIFRSSLWSSTVASLKLSAAVVSPAFLMPPLSGFFMSAAGGILATTIIAGPIHAELQKRKFLNKTDLILNNNPEISENEKLDMQKIKTKLLQLMTIEPNEHCIKKDIDFSKELLSSSLTETIKIGNKLIKDKVSARKKYNYSSTDISAKRRGQNLTKSSVKYRSN